MKVYSWILICSGLVALIMLIPESGAAQGQPEGPFEARPFPLSSVKLLDGPFEKAMNRTNEYLKFIDPDRMLYSFRKNYGLPTHDAEPPGGWEAPDGKLRGHSLGHILVALSQAFASTGDQQFKAKAIYMIDELSKCQDLAESKGYGKGYLSAYGEYQFEELEVLQTYPNIWAPYYTQHKLFSGLLSSYYVFGYEKALEMVKKMGLWVNQRLSRVSREQLQKMWDIYIAGEYGGMNDVLAELHALTGVKDYITAAKYFDHDKIFIPVAGNQDKLSGNHANQTIPKITGALRIYDQTGERRYFDIAANFWQMVTDHHAYIIGGISEGEMFHDPDVIGAKITNKTCETCCTYNMLKLTKQLYMHNPLAQYMDYYERALYNHILASQDLHSDHGFTTYMVPLAPGAKKRYSNDYESFTCCHGTGLENHTKYGESIYFHDDTTLWVNLFIASELDWQARNLSIRQETMYPYEQGSRLEIKGNGRFAIKIRRPFWTDTGFIVAVNGVVQPVTSRPGSYLTLDRDWSNGDRIDIDMPFSFRLEYTRDVPDLAGIMYGPVLLGGENITEMTRLDIDPEDPGSQLIPDPEDPLHFMFGDISFEPFFRIHGIPYSVYFKVKPLR